MKRKRVLVLHTYFRSMRGVYNLKSINCSPTIQERGNFNNNRTYLPSNLPSQPELSIRGVLSLLFVIRIPTIRSSAAVFLVLAVEKTKSY
jgi:hypothetical protein